MTLTVENLLNLAMTNSVNAALVERLPDLRLEQCFLTAGCLFQAVWNHQANWPGLRIVAPGLDHRLDPVP